MVQMRCFPAESAFSPNLTKARFPLSFFANSLQVNMNRAVLVSRFWPVLKEWPIAAASSCVGSDLGKTTIVRDTSVVGPVGKEDTYE